jgi:hypothetical protein
MALMLAVIVAVFTATMALLLYIQDVPFDAAVTKALVLSFVEVLLVAAVAIFFSSFSSPFLSGIFTLGIFILGRTTGAMREALADDKFDGLIEVGLRVGTNVLPDLHLFAISGSTVEGEHVSVHADFVSWGYVASATTYGTLYIAGLLTLAIVIFSRRDFA